MGARSCLKYIFICLLELALLFTLIVYVPFLPPDAKIDTPYNVEYSKELKLNKKLNNVKLWHENQVYGPEAFADYNGELYTSLNTGHIVKLTGNHITPIVSFGKPCKAEYEAPICGRPLGLNFDSAGNLYAADAYYGIFKVDVHTGTTENIISTDKEIGGKKPKLTNSLVIADNNDIYFTDSSTEFSLHDGVYDMLADGSGRLIKYDAKTKSSKVLLDKLHFPNGIAFSGNKDFVIVAETARNRIHRFYISGPKANQHDIFVDKLPGMPDNLKPDGRGGFLVPLVVAADAGRPSVQQLLGPYPKLRRLIARLFGIAELLFVKIDQMYPNEFCTKAAYMIGHFTSVNIVLPSRVTILHISGDGIILDSIHADNNKIIGISETHIFKDTLYLGSPYNPYIGTIPLKDIGWSHLQRVPIAETAPKPAKATPETTTTPKPTTTSTPDGTTTPKPTTTTPKQTATTPKPAATPKSAPTTAESKVTEPPPQKAASTTAEPKATEAAPKKAASTTAEAKATETAPKKAASTTAEPKTTETAPKKAASTTAEPKTTETPPPKVAPITAKPKTTQTPPQEAAKVKTDPPPTPEVVTPKPSKPVDNKP